MLGKRLVVTLVVGIVLAVELVLIRSSLSAFRSDLQQRPNCALVDDAVRRHEAPDQAVAASCRASARGLIYSLHPEDLRALRKPR
jgi:hypothetical protein